MTNGVINFPVFVWWKSQRRAIGLIHGIEWDTINSW